MRKERGLSWLGAIGILLAGFLALVAFALLTTHGHPRHLVDRAEDTNTLRQVVRLMGESKQIQASADGRIDVYKMMFEGREPEENLVQLLRSVRADVQVTEKEIRAGDYRSFPWERARVEDVRKRMVLWDGSWGIESHKDARPLLWERKSYHDVYLVAFTDGSVKGLSPDEFSPVVRRE